MQREKLIEYRKANNKTQEEMAKKWGITLSFYKQIEAGLKNPSLNNIKKFKRAYPNADINVIFLS